MSKTEHQQAFAILCMEHTQEALTNNGPAPKARWVPVLPEGRMQLSDDPEDYVDISLGALEHVRDALKSWNADQDRIAAEGPGGPPLRRPLILAHGKSQQAPLPESIRKDFEDIPPEARFGDLEDMEVREVNRRNWLLARVTPTQAAERYIASGFWSHVSLQTLKKHTDPKTGITREGFPGELSITATPRVAEASFDTFNTPEKLEALGLQLSENRRVVPMTQPANTPDPNTPTTEPEGTQEPTVEPAQTTEDPVSKLAEVLQGFGARLTSMQEQIDKLSQAPAPATPTPEPAPEVSLSEVMEKLSAVETQLKAGRNASFAPSGANGDSPEPPVLALSEDWQDIRAKQPTLTKIQAVRQAQANKRKNASRK